MAYSAACNPAADRLQHVSSWAGRAGWRGSALALTQARRAPAHPHQGPPAESNKTNRQASSCGTLASGCIQLPNCMRVCRAAGTPRQEHRAPPVRRCRSLSRTPCARGTPRCCSRSRNERAVVRFAYLPEAGAVQCNRGSDGAEVAPAASRLSTPHAPPLVGQAMPSAQHVAAVDPCNVLHPSQPHLMRPFL